MQSNLNFEVNNESISSTTETTNKMEQDMSDTKMDFYKILGLNEEATFDEIKKKWLKLSLIYHPDKCEGNDEMFRKINLAYKVLSNPINRKKYNDSLAKTYDQLKSEQRDINYHINREFLVDEIDAKNNVTKKFDLNKFLNTFQSNSPTELSIVAATVPSKNTKTLDEIMAERDRETLSFKRDLKTDLPDPKNNVDNFNLIFKQVYKPTTEIESIENIDNVDIYTILKQPINLSETNHLINNICQSINTQDFSDPLNDEINKVPVYELNAKINAYREEGNLIDQTLKTYGNYQIDIDDSKKVVLTSDLAQ